MRKKKDLDYSEALVNYGLCFTASKANVFIKEFWCLILKYFPQKAHVFQAELLADEGFIMVYSSLYFNDFNREVAEIFRVRAWLEKAGNSGYVLKENILSWAYSSFYSLCMVMNNFICPKHLGARLFSLMHRPLQNNMLESLKCLKP